MIFRALLPTILALTVLPMAAVSADNPCPDQPTHTYGLGQTVGVRTTTFAPRDRDAGTVSVIDTNMMDCFDGDGIFGDWDGDYDAGMGGAFFGYGTWANAWGCDYRLNVHGPNVAVNDVVFGSNVAFIVGEDDGKGPTLIGPSGAKAQAEVGTSEHFTASAESSGVVWLACETDGIISPSEARGDCISQVYVGTGATCGSGGGDGGYWVFLLGVAATEGGGMSMGNPPTSGIITAY